MDWRGLEEAFKEAAEIVRESGEAALVFHNDADGLCSGAIASLALTRAGIKHRLISIEKVHPGILRLIHGTGHSLYIYLDIGSGRADLVERVAEESGTRAILVDHHDPMRVESSRVINLNPELYGFSGETEVSGSTTTYLFMGRISEIRDAAWMAVVGSAEIPGDLRGLNRKPLEDAVSVGDVEVRQGRKGERYIVRFMDRPWNKVSSTLTAIGSIGYYDMGPYKAVQFLLERKIDESVAAGYEEERKRRFRQAFAYLSRRKLSQGRVVQWFHLGRLFKGLGTKTLGTFTSMLSYRGAVSPEKYLIGFMEFEPSIPGLGRLEGSWVKVSVRTPKRLAEKVKEGLMPPASKLTVEASEKVGGTGDGHSFAASAIIPSGSEERFIELFEEMAQGSS